jgi:2-dehydro-3-deoxyphosphooctonate aldolase (KDO 8-P synthase)
MRTVEISDKIKIGKDQNLLLIAGPCQIQSLEHCLKIARFLQEVTAQLPINLVFKSSFDKANRTSASGARGPGIEAGLEILNEVKKQTGLPLLTDIHDASQAKPVAEVVDILQIPAFLCRQTDLLIAAGETGRAIHVKKGQFLAPDDMKWVASKIETTGNKNIILCERGTCHGYRDLVVDMRALHIMRSLGYPVVFDATHSVQSMGGAGGASGGNREFIPPLARGAAAVGIDGIFIECHEAPETAPSDSASMLNLNDMPALLKSICLIRQAAS